MRYVSHGFTALSLTGSRFADWVDRPVYNRWQSSLKTSAIYGVLLELSSCDEKDSVVYK